MSSLTTDLVIVVPPFANASYPSTAAGILVSGCRQMHISTSVLYANLELASMIGDKVYARIASSWLPHMAGEAVFARLAFPGIPDPEPLLFSGTLTVSPGGPLTEPLAQKDFQRCKRFLNAFLEQTLDKILEKKPRIIGFCSTFQQTNASLAIARLLKKKSPGLLTVMGGFNMRLPMGQAFADLTPMIDCIFSGEADMIFPEFCRNYLQGSLVSIPRLIDCGIVHDLEEVPIPDYEDYSKQLEGFQSREKLPKEWPERLNFESSRGCWWGQTSHCCFCGMNGRNATYRSKSSERVVKELHYLSSRFNVTRFDAVDAIMPSHFPRELFPAIERSDLNLQLLYEVKANLSPPEIDMMVRGGIVTIQPGIESLSTPVLKKMSKGVTACQNFVLLRESLSRSIFVIWNFLVGIPGETREEYRSMIELIPAIFHFQPPRTWGTLKIERFSPCFDDARELGIRNVRPIQVLGSILPPGLALADFSYRFNADWETAFLADNLLVSRFGELIETWMTLWHQPGDRPKLNQIFLRDGRVFIEDTRPCAIDRVFLGDNQTTEVLKILESPVKVDEDLEISQQILEELLRRKFVVKYEKFWVSLVVTPGKGQRLRQEIING
jgi:ribosomal peptide maturation radical SAM protein 1